MNQPLDAFLLDAVPAPSPGLAGAAGRSLPHESAALHVAGEASYIDDLPELAGTLHAALGLSPVACGKLLAIDVEALRRLPGVVAVITAADIPGVNDCGAVVHGEPILADGELRFLGQPVFAVLSEDRELARRAAARAKGVLTVEALEPVLTPLQAHAQGRYVLPPMHLVRESAAGATRAAIDAAPHRLQGTLSVGGQEQFYLEGQISYALPLEGGAMKVHCSTQHPSEMQHVVAHCLGLASHAVQVECRRMGGGFGGKESQSAPFACIAAVAAARLKRPVKLRLDRDDDFLTTGRRHGFEYRYEVGFDAQGRVLGAEIDMVSNAGHSADLSGPVMTRALCHFDNAYWLPEVRMHGYSARTNTQSNTAFRGFGGPQGAIAIEVILDSIARRLALDALAVRRANFYGRPAPASAGPAAAVESHEGSSSPAMGAAFDDRDGAMRVALGAGAAAPGHGEAPGSTPSAHRPVDIGAASEAPSFHDGNGDAPRTPQAAAAGVTTPYGQTVEDNVIHELVDELAASSDYAARRAAIAAFNATSPVLKKGLALTPVKFGISFNVAHFNQAGALVHVYTDGSVLVNHGGTEMGQGLNTKVAQVVAHELGLALERVRVTATDTQKVANTSATAASTGTDLNGKAAQAAARTLRERLAALVAPLGGVPVAEVRFAAGRVIAGPRDLAFEDVVKQAYVARVQLWSDGFYATPGLHWDKERLQGKPFFYFAYGAAVAEVVVDTLTGEHRLLRADVLHDVGRSLNPAIDIGQVEGAFIQGMGWLTTEELVWHPRSGALLTHAPSTYKIPTANDCPPVFKVALFENDNVADSIHRSKAVGEPPLLLPFSVFLAIRDAVSAVGDHAVDPPLRAPATPEAVLDAIEAVQAAV